MMKKYCVFALVLAFALAFVSCGEDEESYDSYIKFTVVGEGGIETPVTYILGENASAQQTYQGQATLDFVLYAEKTTGGAERSIKIFLSETGTPYGGHSWLGTQSCAVDYITPDGVTNFGAADVTLDDDGASPGSYVRGTFSAAFGGAQNLIFSDGVIKLKRDTDIDNSGS